MSSDLFAKCRPPQDYTLLQEAGLYPYFRPIQASEGTEVWVDGRRLVMAGSNNYLGLTHDPRVIAAAQQALAKYGTGCTGSRFLNGTLDLHVRLELRIAELIGKEAALVFSTGYQTCQGVIQALVHREDVILCDRENHASILDGCRLSFGEVRKYSHGDMGALEEQLVKGNGRGQMIVTDGLFSMIGDLAPLPGITALAGKHGARVLVDDAHAFGVLGARGRGTAEHFGVEQEVDLIMGTFSKSLACIGGFCAGPRTVIEFIRHRARSLMFSASTPPAVCATALAALDIIEREPERRRRVLELAKAARRGLNDYGFNTGPVTESPIVPVILGERSRTFLFWKALIEEGVFVNPVTAPAVPQGMDLLRCSFMATHTEQHLERFLRGFLRARERVAAAAAAGTTSAAP